MKPPPRTAFRAALVQMRAGRDVARNVADAVSMIEEAAGIGAQYVQTPECTTLMELDQPRLMAETQPEQSNSALQAFADTARAQNIWVHIGSMGVKVGERRLANRSYLISPDGAIAARYDKIHMFDVDLANGESYRESNNYAPGESAVVCDLPFGRLGITICYDVRFPALYRALAEAGATMLTVPSAFTKQTGEAHWHVLNRARAIENGSFVFAAAQGGKHENGRETFGHSLIVDPWGRVLAEGGTGTGVVMGEVDPAQVVAARSRVPSLQHGRRFEVVEPLAEPARLHLVRSAE